MLEGHALSCPKYLGADSAAPSNSHENLKSTIRLNSVVLF
jgi:hypothetical protein